MTELINKVICIESKKTSMRLASAEWEALDIICDNENVARNHLLNLINTNKSEALGFTCSVRLFLITYFYHLLLKKQLRLNSVQPSPIFAAIKSIL